MNRPQGELASIEVGGINLMRFRAEGDGDTAVVSTVETGDNFYVNSQLLPVRASRLWRGADLLWADARPEGDLSILDRGERWTIEQTSPFDTVRFSLPEKEIERFALENGRPGFGGFQCQPGTIDYIAKGLSLAVLPSLENPASANLVFLEQVVLAMLTHLTQSYGGLHFPPRQSGVLAAWQERRAAEFLSSHLNVPFSIATLAAECGLSRSYFIKAFRATFGNTPYKWLMEYRLLRAKEMLKEDSTLAEIAAACGFSDQSHFTRTFTAATGTSPGAWRKNVRRSL